MNSNVARRISCAAAAFRPAAQHRAEITTDSTAAQPDFTGQASEIVSAYVAHNSVSAGDLPALIRSVHDTLASLGTSAPADAPAEPLKPAVSIRKSITDEHIISLEDGRKFKSLKRYLAGLGMTPTEYRAKWGLPSDYPMVAPAYAAKRSALAKGMQLGRRRAQAAPEPGPAPQPDPKVAAPAPKRGRAKKAT